MVGQGWGEGAGDDGAVYVCKGVVDEGGCMVGRIVACGRYNGGEEVVFVEECEEVVLWGYIEEVEVEVAEDGERRMWGAGGDDVDCCL